MIRNLFGDTETFSPTPLNAGTYRYAANCEVMLFPFAIDDARVEMWDITSGARMPSALEDGLFDERVTLIFHHAMFDRNALRLGNLKLDIPIARWHCTMAQALAHSLPGSLDKLCDIFKIDAGDSKMGIGKELVQFFCKPRPKNMKLRRATRHTHPKDWQDFKLYATTDVAAMRAIYKKMPKWNYTGDELARWHLDQKINDRGMLIDVDFARAAITAVDREQKRLAAEIQSKTNYDAETGAGVKSANQRDKLLEYILAEYGVDLPDMTAATLERRANDPDLPIEVRELIAIRLEASTTSTSKYKRLVGGVNDDNRLRGTIQFCGAGRTGRDAGRVFQPQNLPRPTFKFSRVEEFIEAAKADCADLLYSDEVMGLASSSIRSAIIAPPGSKLVVCDLSNIEGRMAAWLAGEEWKLQAFRDFDNGIGEDLYKVAYGKAFHIDPSSVNKQQRQVGKVKELMLQYEGGVGAFVTGAATYGIDLDELATVAWPTLPGELVHEAEGFLEWTRKKNRSTFGLSREAFVTCDVLKRMWRGIHLRITSYWSELRDAWKTACAQPGVWHECRRVAFRVDGNWLRIRLPSGRFLCYPSPRVGGDGTLSYMGVNQYSRKWCRLKTYGGKLFENVTQASSLDVFKHGQTLAEAEGFDVVLPVHDELVTEGDGIERLREIMSTNPKWCPDLPLAAAGFETQRYRKED